MDFRLRCTTISRPAEPPLDAPEGGTVTIVTPPGPGPSGDSHPEAVERPDHGTVVPGGHNTLVYSADPGFTGTDSFVYTYIDRHGQTVRVPVRVRVREALADTGADAALPTVGLAGAGLVAVGALLTGAGRARRRRRRS